MKSETFRCIIRLKGFSKNRQRRDFKIDKCSDAIDSHVALGILGLVSFML
jgi:hypothetical protein